MYIYTSTHIRTHTYAHIQRVNNTSFGGPVGSFFKTTLLIGIPIFTTVRIEF